MGERGEGGQKKRRKEKTLTKPLFPSINLLSLFFPSLIFERKKMMVKILK